MTVRELRDHLNALMWRPDDGEKPVADLDVVLAVYDPEIEDASAGRADPVSTHYDDEVLWLHATKGT